MQPELSRPVPFERVGPRGLEVTVEASAEECVALAERLGLPAVVSLVCRFRLSQEGKTRVRAKGHLRAVVVRTCVVSLENFQAEVEEDFQVRFVPASEIREDLDLDEDDEVPIENGVLDVGEAAVEQLGLALDPYPRMPGAELPVPEEDGDDHPMAALRRLKRLN
jgi:uncharacterized metal-binding protein YceD (DUF177 family)